MTRDVPVVSMQKGKLQGGGGDAPDPGQVHSPPGAWPGSSPSPLQPPPSDWAAGGDADDIVTAPVPALQAVAGRYASGLPDIEWLAFCRATVNRDESLSLGDQKRLIDYAEPRAARDRVLLAGLEAWYQGIRKVIEGRHDKETPT